MTTTRLNDLFDQLEPEKGNKLDDKIQIEGDTEPENLIINVLKNNSNQGNMTITLNEYFQRADKNPYSSRQITKFSNLLNDHLLETIGWHHIEETLYWLITNSEDSVHNIFTNHIKYEMVHLGRGLKNKTLNIYGNAGHNVGEELTKGKIIVHGDAETSAGKNMYSGEIKIKGNCAESVGFNMKEGLIEIEGNCKEEVGMFMDGGEIIVKGNADDVGVYMRGGTVKVHGDKLSISEKVDGGDIYHKDKLIVKNGKILDETYLR